MNPTDEPNPDDQPKLPAESAAESASETESATVKISPAGSSGSNGGSKDTPKPSSGFMAWLSRSFNPFRIATLRGLAIVLPPLLTVIFFFWLWSTLERAILHPIERMAGQVVVWRIDDTKSDKQIKKLAKETQPGRPAFSEVGDHRVFTTATGIEYTQVNSNWVPREVFETVEAKPGGDSLNTTRDYYLRFVQLRYLKRHLVIPAFLALFLALMYLVGKLLAVGIGRFFYHYIEAIIHRVPIIRNVYSSVKQVTDFAFSDNDIQFNRVVAVEYPRRGIWSVGFVTGEGMSNVRDAAGEPIVSILMPTSPMPMTGFTIFAPKSQTVDLDLTIDQAIQFCISCGVVIPDHQIAKTGDVQEKP
jgi:uncharacterized membrane protein